MELPVNDTNKFGSNIDSYWACPMAGEHLYPDGGEHQKSFKRRCFCCRRDLALAGVWFSQFYSHSNPAA